MEQKIKIKIFDKDYIVKGEVDPLYIKNEGLNSLSGRVKRLNEKGFESAELNKFEKAQVDKAKGNDPSENYIYYVGRLKGSSTHAVSIVPKQDVIVQSQINEDAL